MPDEAELKAGVIELDFDEASDLLDFIDFRITSRITDDMRTAANRAFARHRTASVKAALEAAARVAEEHALNSDGLGTEEEAASWIAMRIRAIDLDGLE